MEVCHMRINKWVAALVVLAGLAFVYFALTTPVPGTDLTTFTFLDGMDNHSTIKEYVGGDAYNYIIGASLVGARISGTMAANAIYLGFGALLISLGLFGLTAGKAPQKAQETLESVHETPAAPVEPAVAEEMIEPVPADEEMTETPQ